MRLPVAAEVTRRIVPSSPLRLVTSAATAFAPMPESTVPRCSAPLPCPARVELRDFVGGEDAAIQQLRRSGLFVAERGQSRRSVYFESGPRNGNAGESPTKGGSEKNIWFCGTDPFTFTFREQRLDFLSPLPPLAPVECVWLVSAATAFAPFPETIVLHCFAPLPCPARIELMDFLVSEDAAIQQLCRSGLFVADGSRPAESPVGAASSASMPLLRSFVFSPFANYKDAAPMGLGKGPPALSSTFFESRHTLRRW